MSEKGFDTEVDAALRRRFTPPARLEERAFDRALAQLGTPRARRALPWRMAGALLALAAGLALLARLLATPREEPGSPPPSVVSSGDAPRIIETRPPAAPALAEDPTWHGPACAVGPLEDAPAVAETTRVVRPDLEKIYAQAVGWSQTGVQACTGESWCTSEGTVCLKSEAAALLAGPFSSEDWPTGTLWTGPPQEDTAVLVADLDATHRCCLDLALPEGSTLHLFMWRVDGVMLTEITPHGEPRLLDCFESTRAR